MSETQENLKNILKAASDGLDTGNTRLDEKEMEFLIDTLKEVTSPEISSYSAIKISKYEKSQFYKLIKDGLLPPGYHVQGFKENVLIRHVLRRL